MKHKKILITGTGGFLGGALYNHLHGTTAYSIEGHDRRRCDLLNRENLSEYFSEIQPDVVIHCAALCGGLLMNKDNPGLMLTENLAMNANVLAACMDYKVEKIVLLGTSCSYSPDAPQPLREDDSFGKNLTLENATGAYGIAKYTTWQMAEACSQQSGLRFDYLIPGNLYGPRDNFLAYGGHVVPTLIKKFADNTDQVYLIGPSSNTRDFLYVDDACRAIASCLNTDTEGTPLNIGSGKEVLIGDLADTIKSITGSSATINWESIGVARHPRRVLDISRAEKVLGWKPETGLLAGLKKTVEWYRRTYHGK